MNSNKLIITFVHALGWNAFSYGAYKICFLLVSYALYATLPEQHFTLWASLMSFTFFWLLILDGGFRKSVPRFCPEFSSSRPVHRTFVRWLCSVQAILLLVAVPVYYWLLPHFCARVQLPVSQTLCLLATILFFAQGCLSLMRIIYHAHFWNKQFNRLATLIVCIECIVSFLFCFFSPDSDSSLLYKILIINCVGALATTIVSFCRMPPVTLIDKEYDPISLPMRTRQFIKHTLFMWGANAIKALSERNFLFPYIVYSLGPTIGITFKLSNDAALFFYRIAIKTIGINDTALLSYARQCPHGISGVFFSLVRTILYIVIPLMVIASMSIVVIQLRWPAYIVYIVPFCIFVWSYMIEVLLSPYERILEVSLHYKQLIVAYIPYAALLLAILYYQTISAVGFLFFISIIQALRLVSALIMVYYARRLLLIKLHNI